MTLGVRGKLFVTSVGLMLVVFAASGVVLEAQLRAYMEREIETQLRGVARALRESLVVAGAPQAPDRIDATVDRLGRAAGVRLTVIAADGRVLGDTEFTPAQLPDVENHRGRDEVRGALAGREQAARRESRSVHAPLLYVAVPWPGLPGVVRVSRPLADVDAAVSALRVMLLLAASLGLLIAAVMSALAARLAGSLDRMADELHRTDLVRRDFVANVSHELRTPVAVIRANSETLLDGAIDDPVQGRRFAEAIARSSERLSALITDLLDLARIEAGAYGMEARSLALPAAVDAAFRQLASAAAARGVTFVNDVGPALRVSADPKALDHVLFNLIDNAIKHGREQGRVVVLAQAKGAEVFVHVRDDGPGVSERHRARIFERFYRVDPGRSRAVGGTGLGLSIVKHLVLGMGGRVGVEPGEPSGSDFWFSVPGAPGEGAAGG